MKKIIHLFSGFLAVLVAAGCSSMISDLKDLSKDAIANYVIEKKFESAVTDDYDSTLFTVSDVINGAPSKAVIDNVEGFYIDEKKIVENDRYPELKVEKIVQVFYRRNRVSLSFDPKGGYSDLIDSVYTINGKCGAAVPVTVENPQRIDFTFIGWYLKGDESKTPVAVPLTFPAESMELEADWNRSYGRYTVEYMAQGLDGVYEVFAREEKGGEPSETSVVTQTEIDANKPAGFTYLNKSADQTIGDGGFTLEVKYQRNTHDVTFKPDGGKWPDDTTGDRSYSAVMFGTDLTTYTSVEPSKGEGDDEWTFIKWYVESNEFAVVPVIMPDEDVVLVAKWARPAAPYKVEHYIEKIDEEGSYDLIGDLTQTKKGAVGELTEALPLTAKDSMYLKGYTFADSVQTEVLENGESVAKVYYDRNIVTVKYECNGGGWTSEGKTVSEKSFTAKYGTAISALFTENPAKELHSFAGWLKNGSGSVVAVLPDSVPADNVTYVAKWNKTGCLYGVRFFFEKIDSTDSSVLTNYEEDFERKFADGTNAVAVTLAGAYGENTKAHDVVQTVTGFEQVDFDEKTIADGSEDLADANNISVYFKRNLVTFSYKKNDGVSGIVTKTGRFETSVGDSDLPGDVERKDYKFLGWVTDDYAEPFDDIKTKYPQFIKDVVFDAKWELTGTDYTIIYLFEGADGTVDGSGNVTQEGTYEANDALCTEYNLAKKKTGSHGSMTSVQAPLITGYDSPSYTDVEIGEGTSVTVKYARKVVSIKFYANGGSWKTGDADYRTIYGKFGCSIPSTGVNSIPSDADLTVKKFCEYGGWYLSTDGTEAAATLPSVFPAANVQYNVKWINLDTAEAGGEAEKAGQEILLSASGTGSQRKFTATVPYENASEWNFTWVCDGKTLGAETTFETSGKTQSFTKTDLNSGNHSVRVYAYLKGTVTPVLSNLISVKVQ